MASQHLDEGFSEETHSQASSDEAMVLLDGPDLKTQQLKAELLALSPKKRLGW